ncbi:MAG: hypothetical protein HDT39_00935 [Lachnospiraceae bacterium]|nr:hypothetical protein [Lachnospiraceae bacterium]
MFKRCLKSELKKALFNKAAFIAFIFTIFLSLMHSAGAIRLCSLSINELNKGKINGNPMITMISLYVRWLGADGSSVECGLFYFLLPLIIVVPYGWSLISELNSGYIKNIVCRVNRRNYFISKYISVFISASSIVIITLLLNVLVLALFLPALKPEGIYPYGTIGQMSMWSGLFYEHPLLYTIMYILLDGIFAGLIAVTTVALSFAVKRKILVMLIPFFGLLLLDYLNTHVAVNCEFSPIKFLQTLPVIFDRYGVVIASEGILLFVVTFVITLYRGRHYEVL